MLQLHRSLRLCATYTHRHQVPLPATLPENLFKINNVRSAAIAWIERGQRTPTGRRSDLLCACYLTCDAIRIQIILNFLSMLGCCVKMLTKTLNCEQPLASNAYNELSYQNCCMRRSQLPTALFACLVAFGNTKTLHRLTCTCTENHL